MEGEAYFFLFFKLTVLPAVSHENGLFDAQFVTPRLGRRDTPRGGGAWRFFVIRALRGYLLSLTLFLKPSHTMYAHAIIDLAKRRQHHAWREPVSSAQNHSFPVEAVRHGSGLDMGTPLQAELMVSQGQLF